MSTPLKHVQAKPSVEERAGGALGNTRSRILLATDDTELRESAWRQLNRDYEVEAATDGVAALAAARVRPPELILAEVRLPKLDGLSLLRAWRADERTARTPVMLLAAWTDEEARVAAVEAGAVNCLVKPFTMRELHACVSVRLTQARAQQAAEQRALHILDSLSDGFQAIDASWRYTYVNPAIKRWWAAQGFEPEVIGRRVFEVFPEARDTELGRAFTRAMTERTSLELESFSPLNQRWYAVRYYPTPEGGVSVLTQDITERKEAERQIQNLNSALQQRVDELNTLLFDEHGEVRQVIAAYADYTERKRVEDALRAREAQLQTLFDAAPLGIYLVDADFRIRQVNPTARPPVEYHPA
jgi:PAS domain S-box-containing protein